MSGLSLVTFRYGIFYTDFKGATSSSLDLISTKHRQQCGDRKGAQAILLSVFKYYIGI